MLDREFIFLILHEAMPEMLNVMNWRVVILWHDVVVVGYGTGE
jgi:hypothetical protein